MKKQALIIILVLVIITAAVVYLRFVIGGDEDTWLCKNGQWVKHGNPAAPIPNTGCGEANTNTIINANTNTNKSQIPIEEVFSDKIVYGTGLSEDLIPSLQQDCQERQGTFSECGSPCASDAELCITVCAYVCILNNDDSDYFPPAPTQQEREDAAKLPKESCPCWDGANEICLPQADCI